MIVCSSASRDRRRENKKREKYEPFIHTVAFECRCRCGNVKHKVIFLLFAIIFLDQSCIAFVFISLLCVSLVVDDQAELADVLRKRKSRSDASDEDLGLPHSPSTPPRNGLHAVDGNSSSSNGKSGRNPHHSSLGLLSMASSDIYDDASHSFHARNQLTVDSNGNRGLPSDEIFPELSSSTEGEMKLSHSAAKHKMAVRPKKKGPSRPSRRATEVRSSFLSPTFKANAVPFSFPEHTGFTVHPRNQRGRIETF